MDVGIKVWDKNDRETLKRKKHFRNVQRGKWWGRWIEQSAGGDPRGGPRARVMCYNGEYCQG